MPHLARPVVSAQIDLHTDLPRQLDRHRQSVYQKPLADYNRSAYAEMRARWDGAAPLILDAGCGVGWSTLQLAAQYPDHFVVGVDQSADRLARGKPSRIPDNACFIRADLVDFWRLLAMDQVILARHYLLYPNPWPKPEHLKRRWHGHPVFPSILALGGIVECRSNWSIYLQELAYAMGVFRGRAPVVEAWHPTQFLTPFERKYHAAGQDLWRLCDVLPVQTTI